MKPFKLKKTIILVLASLFLLTGFATADAKSKDTSWQFHDIVDAAFVKANVSVPMSDNVMIIDARPYKGKFIKGHIPGAINIPDTEFAKKVDLLPKDKSALLIYYCQGVKCKLSHKSAKKAEKLGYTNVKVYAKGYPNWIAQKGNYGSISAEFLAKMIADNKTMVIDSRPLITKYNKGHIPTSISIPFTKFEALSGKMPIDANTPLVFYCGGLKCKLSHKSAAKALEMGYNNVTVFAKGYPEWKKQFGASGESVAVKAGEVEGSIDLAKFKEILAKNPASISLIDVRDADEFGKGHFKPAQNIPVDQLEPQIKTLSDAKPIIYVCSTGARSGEAYYMTKEVREALKDVYYVEAEIDYNSDGTFTLKKPQ